MTQQEVKRLREEASRISKPIKKPRKESETIDRDVNLALRRLISEKWNVVSDEVTMLPGATQTKIATANVGVVTRSMSESDIFFKLLPRGLWIHLSKESDKLMMDINPSSGFNVNMPGGVTPSQYPLRNWFMFWP